MDDEDRKDAAMQEEERRTALRRWEERMQTRQDPPAAPETAQPVAADEPAGEPTPATPDAGAISGIAALLIGTARQWLAALAPPPGIQDGARRVLDLRLTIDATGPAITWHVLDAHGSEVPPVVGFGELLRHILQIAASMPWVDDVVRRDAKRLLARMAELGKLQRGMAQ